MPKTGFYLFKDDRAKDKSCVPGVRQATFDAHWGSVYAEVTNNFLARRNLSNASDAPPGMLGQVAQQKGIGGGKLQPSAHLMTTEEGERVNTSTKAMALTFRPGRIINWGRRIKLIGTGEVATVMGKTGSKKGWRLDNGMNVLKSEHGRKWVWYDKYETTEISSESEEDEVDEAEERAKAYKFQVGEVHEFKLADWTFQNGRTKMAKIAHIHFSDELLFKMNIEYLDGKWESLVDPDRIMEKSDLQLNSWEPPVSHEIENELLDDPDVVMGGSSSTGKWSGRKRLSAADRILKRAMEGRLEKHKEGDQVFVRLQALVPKVRETDYYSSATGWDTYALNDDMRIALKQHIKSKNDLLNKNQQDLECYSRAMQCPLPPRANMQVASHYLWEAIQTLRPTFNPRSKLQIQQTPTLLGAGGQKLTTITETGEGTSKDGNTDAKSEEKKDDGAVVKATPPKPDDPNKLYPGDKIHASWDQRFKQANPGDPGEYDGSVIAVTPFNLTVQFTNESGRWTFRVMNGCFYDVQNFAVMIYLVKRGSKAPTNVSKDPKQRTKQDDYKLVLNYLYRKRGKSVLSVLQGDIKVDLKIHGFKQFRDFLECIPGVVLTQKGSVVFAEMTRDFLRMGPAAWANLEQRAVTVVNQTSATQFPAGGGAAQRAMVVHKTHKRGYKGSRAVSNYRGNVAGKMGRIGRSPITGPYAKRKDPERIRMNGQSLYAQLRTCNPSARKEDYYRNGKWDLDSLADDLRLLNLKTSQILRSVASGQRKTVEDW